METTPPAIRTSERETLARKRARAALRDLAALEIEARVIGSLANGGFSRWSDVDFLVDCPGDREGEALVVLERAMAGFPFDMIPKRRVQPEILAFIEPGALDASALCVHEAAS